MKKEPTKQYRVLRQFTLGGTLYGRIDKPAFTDAQVAAIAKKNPDGLPIEEIKPTTAAPQETVAKVKKGNPPAAS